MNMYFRQQGGGEKFESVKNPNDHDKYRKEMRDHLVHMFSRWMYDTGIAFNVVNYESFGEAIEAIGQYGPGIKAPTYHEVRTKFLDKEKECIDKDAEEHIDEAKKKMDAL
ncbi:hypothetical protein LIER_33842 [Lithospermum erythrorhizon]|uniref:Uncharacterized protein n=1 Tax=Lithospermum erythrorhizon TaxID=34254 RepID=A0AAV3S026_LITER